MDRIVFKSRESTPVSLSRIPINFVEQAYAMKSEHRFGMGVFYGFIANIRAEDGLM